MGVLIYVVVEIVLGIASFASFQTDHPYWGWGFLIAFLLGLVPVLGDDVFDLF